MWLAFAAQQADLVERYDFQLPVPMTVPAGTLVLADTTGFHMRGIASAGTARALMGLLREGSNVNPWQREQGFYVEPKGSGFGTITHLPQPDLMSMLRR
jgi:hypothetical protein